MKLPAGYVAGVGVHKATAYGGLGQKLLEKMGWSKGQGLGKEKAGIKAAIEVKKKDDSIGVGAKAAAWEWDKKYWEEAYNSAIQNINHETSSSSSSGGSSASGASTSSTGGTSSSSSDSSDSDSDSGRGRGKRARKGPAAAGKAGPVVNRDGTLASASAAELKIAAELAKDPWGRWGGRGGKMARIRAQEQEEANRARAKLGLPPLPEAAPPAAADSSDSSSSDDSDDDKPGTSGRGAEQAERKGRQGKGKEKAKKKGKAEEAEGKQSKKGKKERRKAEAGEGDAQAEEAAPAPARKKRLVVVLGTDAMLEARKKMFASFTPTPATGWWGAKYFVSAGLVESLEDEEEGDQRLAAAEERLEADKAAGRVGLSGAAAVAAGQRQGFKEADQEALYKRVHDFQRVGRRGLGKGEIKVGGAKWEGTKKTFGEDDDEEEADGEEAGAGKAGEAEEEEEEQPASEGEGKKRKRDKAAKKEAKAKKAADAAAEAEAEAEAAAAAAEPEAGRKGKKRKAAAAAEAAAAEAAAEEGQVVNGDVPAAPQPKWLKLARTVLKQSAKRRLKLRAVVEQLLEAAEAQHREHHHKHHHHHHHSKHSGKAKKGDKKKAGKNGSAEAGPAEGGEAEAGAVAVPASPWDVDSVRQALERKMRKSNSGLALDGKFLTLVEEGGDAAQQA
ncbi:hypothetical protein HYH03_005369 [Edaphochlamys debaryana]|uniref:G-patch domain-containing protein n=1 Tax=Edaphochlamys debaryana TaxID=47281 RepID=A0A835Y5T3_9CHLO|nr:hypothetical protein HYH03_005369 [Edaphochlamys debaryana]|eukprot:KAG2496546.1 hypothetical protein HYH03_005369 [Edaphochlamys debaryana]